MVFRILPFVSPGLLLAAVAAPAAAPAADLAAGKEIYASTCSSCHGLDGRSVVTEVPSFARGERLEKDDATLMASIRDGVPDRMPPWGGFFDDRQIADVLAYIRRRFGTRHEKNR